MADKIAPEEYQAFDPSGAAAAESPSQGGAIKSRIVEGGQQVSEKTKQAASAAMSTAKDVASMTAEKARDTAAAAFDKAKGTASAIAQDASRRAGDLAKNVGHKAEDTVASVGGQMKTLAGTIRDKAPQQGMVGSAASTMANTLESSGSYLQEHNLHGMAEDMTGLIRRYPLQSLLVGIGIGFLLARVTRR